MVGETKEVNVAVRKTTDDKGGPSLQGGLSAARHEMLLAMRKEDDEPWQNLEYYDGEVSVYATHVILFDSETCFPADGRGI